MNCGTSHEKSLLIGCFLAQCCFFFTTQGIICNFFAAGVFAVHQGSSPMQSAAISFVMYHVSPVRPSLSVCHALVLCQNDAS